MGSRVIRVHLVDFPITVIAYNDDIVSAYKIILDVRRIRRTVDLNYTGYPSTVDFGALDDALPNALETWTLYRYGVHVNLRYGQNREAINALLFVRYFRGY